jgi:3-oxoadipate enol-lactonase
MKEPLMKIKANGISINYQIDGPELAPWIVFSNSLATTTAMWDEQTAALKDKFRVLRYDQRGHGGSDVPSGRYPFDTLVTDALALLDALLIKRANFAGLSMGGATALGLAERHPERVDRIIVCDSPCQSTPQSSQQWEERIVVAQKEGIEVLVEPTIGRWFPAETVAKNPPHLDKVRAMIRNTPVDGFVGCAAALADHDYASAVATVKNRVLFLVGEKDAPGPAMRKLHDRLPGSRFVEIPGAGHISNMDRPAEFNRAILDFLTAA